MGVVKSAMKHCSAHHHSGKRPHPVAAKHAACHSTTALLAAAASRARTWSLPRAAPSWRPSAPRWAAHSWERARTSSPRRHETTLQQGGRAGISGLFRSEGQQLTSEGRCAEAAMLPDCTCCSMGHTAAAGPSRAPPGRGSSSVRVSTSLMPRWPSAATCSSLVGVLLPASKPATTHEK